MERNNFKLITLKGANYPNYPNYPSYPNYHMRVTKMVFHISKPSDDEMGGKSYQEKMIFLILRCDGAQVISRYALEMELPFFPIMLDVHNRIFVIGEGEDVNGEKLVIMIRAISNQCSE